MGKKITQREDDIDQITDVDVLRARLKSAEQVCVLVAWSAAPDQKWARGRLEYRYWSEWHGMVGQHGTHPKANTDIQADVKSAEAEDRKYGFYRKENS